MVDRVYEATQLIRNMDNDELNSIITEIKQRRTRLGRRTVQSLTRGHTVEFKTVTGMTVQGTVTKVNRKTVHVNAGVHGNYKVDALLVSRVDNATA